MANVHLKQAAFRCDHCGKGFMDKTNFEDHVARHEGISRYVCHLCTRDFISKGEAERYSDKTERRHGPAGQRWVIGRIKQIKHFQHMKQI